MILIEKRTKGHECCSNICRWDGAADAEYRSTEAVFGAVWKTHHHLHAGDIPESSGDRRHRGALCGGWHEYLQKIAEEYGITKLLRIVPGGKTTQDSKLNALYALREVCKDEDIVLMHDAVRPLITPKLIDDNIAAVKTFGSAITVDPFTETGIVSEDGQTVSETIERQKLYIAKAPQSFYYGDVLAAHEAAKTMPEATTIDTCTIMTALGKTLHFVPCDGSNIKITRPEDYYIFKAIHDLRESQAVLGL